MPLELWFAFVLASAVLLVVPGPTVALVVTYAFGHGRRAAAAIVAGVALGDGTAMTASWVGLGAALLASPTLFEALRWAGIAYLLWMGIALWRARVAGGGGMEDAGEDGREDADAATAPLGRIFGHAFAVTVLNPATIGFFVAFVPQFVDPDRPVAAQAVLLTGTFVALAAANAAAYALLGARAAESVRAPGMRRLLNRVGAATLMAIALLALALRLA